MYRCVYVFQSSNTYVCVYVCVCCVVMTSAHYKSAL